MTLIIALRCTDGVIMASDSQSTEEAGNIGYPVPKIFELIPRAVWGGSGSGQIIRELRQQFDSVRDQLEASPAIAQSLVSVVKPVLQAHYNNFIPNVPGLAPGSPATGVLAAGYSKDSGAWIVEVDPRCQYTHYDELGFHAIGSAAGFAQLANALMAHFEPKNRPLSHGMLVAYRVMDAAIETSGFGVGPPIQMWVVDAKGARELAKEELDEVQSNVGGWKELETNALDELLTPSAEAQQDELPPEVEGDS